MAKTCISCGKMWSPGFLSTAKDSVSPCLDTENSCSRGRYRCKRLFSVADFSQRDLSRKRFWISISCRISYFCRFLIPRIRVSVNTVKETRLHHTIVNPLRKSTFWSTTFPLSMSTEWIPFSICAPKLWNGCSSSAIHWVVWGCKSQYGMWVRCTCRCNSVLG